MQFHGFTVSVVCEGKVLPEFAVQAEGDKTFACYIPSEVGKSFRIRFQDGDPTRPDCHSVRCSIDGRQMGSSQCRPGQRGSRWGVRTAVDARRPFQFAQLVTTDADEVLRQGPSHGDIGVIKVQLVRVREECQAAFKPNEDCSDLGPVHEKSKKGGSHCVSFGTTTRCLPKSRVSVTELDPKGIFTACFIFRYRSKDMLQAQGIMPVVGERNSSNNSFKSTSGKKRAADSGHEPEFNRKRQKSESHLPLSTEDIKQTFTADTMSMKRGLPVKRAKREHMSSHTVVDPHPGIIDLTLED